MILFALRDYIQAHPNCTLEALAKQFSLSEDGVDAMLSEWIKRGRLKVSVSERKGGQVKHFIWVEGQELGVTVLY